MATTKQNRKKRYPRISLGQKMTSVFVFFVIVPFVCVSFLSAFFFQKSVHSWFKDRIQVAMNGAEYIAERYMQDNLNRMHNVSSKVMEQYKIFSQQPLSDAIDRPPLFDQHLENIHQTHQCASVVFSSDTPLSNSHIMIDPLFATHEWNKKLPVRIALQTIETAKKTNSTVVLSHQDHHLCILHYLGNHQFLMTGQVLDPVIGDNVFYVNSAIHSYMDDLKQESRWFWSSIAVFLVSCFVLMLLAWWGIARFKFNIIEPVNSLLQGVSMLRAGKISKVKISKKNTSREIDVLVTNFNEMALDIHTNQEHLSLVNQSLQEQNTFMETVVHSVSSGIILLNEKGEILFNNDQAEHLLNSKKIKGMHITSLPLSLNDTLHTARHDPSRIHKKDLFSPTTRKTYRIYMRCHSPSKHVIVTMDDIGSLIASQKRSAILDVARHVAHEIRNPLTPIMLAAQRLGHKYGNVVDDTLVFQNCIDSIVRQSEIISNIIKEFLYFVRMPLAHFSECDVSLLIQKNVDLQQAAYPNITFHTHVPPCHASIDALHIERAINNLMKNAIESVLDVEHEKAITVTLTEKNDMIMITIADTGTGLDTSYVLSDQEPYSSKKPHGMGIGLSIVEQVAKDHGGYFTIQNNTKSPGTTAIMSIARHH